MSRSRPRGPTSTTTVVVAALLVIATLFAHVALRAVVAGQSVAAADADAAIGLLELELDRLTVDVGELGDPERIAELATSMGLGPAEHIWRIPDSDAEGAGR